MEIYGNPVPPSALRGARRRRRSFARRFGFDPQVRYRLTIESQPALPGVFDLDTLALATSGTAPVLSPASSLVVGTIRMGYGHYRMALAIASAARALGFRPLWLDLLSLEGTTGAAVIHHMEGLYSLGSRLSRHLPLFDKLYWERLTAHRFRKLTYNAADREMCTLMAPVFHALDPSLPVIGTHSWVCQAAIHAGSKHVVNTIPDNWPLALHLSEGAVHTVQSPSAYLGYRLLQDMGRRGQILRPMPASSLVFTGNYVDHELVSNLEADTAARLRRIAQGQPPRLLFSLGGAGAQAGLAAAIIRHCATRLRQGSLTVFLNLGQHHQALEAILRDLAPLSLHPTLHSHWGEITDFAQSTLSGGAQGLHLFHHPSVFPAVYTTNLLLRSSDILLTKPSELAFYPLPRLFLPRIGGHEAWGAIRAAELGEGTLECTHANQACQTLDLLLTEPDLLREMNSSILALHHAGLYRGAYRAVELAMGQQTSPDDPISPT